MIEKRFALILASNEYEDADFKQLVAPAQDAKALETVLKNPAIGGFQVKTMLNEHSYRLNQEIESFFTERQRDDLLLIYFSCHGIKDIDGRLYFATTDTRRKLLKSTAVSANFVNDIMYQSHSLQQLLILDCCYSGAFARGLVAKTDKTIHIKEHFEGRGRVVLTASDATQYSFEGDTVEGQGIRSVFTRALVHGLETGEADIDGNGLVTYDELYDYIHNRVRVETPQQSPRKWAFDVQGDIIIAQNLNPIAKAGEKLSLKTVDKLNIGEYLSKLLVDSRVEEFNNIRKKNHYEPLSLIGTNIIGAKLSGVKLGGTNLTNAAFINVDLSRADLTNSDLTNARLSEANLIGAKLNGAALNGAVLYRADLTNSDLTNARLSEANLIGAKLNGANLVGAKLNGANLVGAKLNGAMLNGTDLTKANLSFTDLTGADLYNATLQDADLRDIKNLPISKKYARSRGAKVSYFF